MGLRPSCGVCALAAALGSSSQRGPPARSSPACRRGFVDELVVGGLPFPTAVAFTPDGRMLVALKRGEVRMYQGTTPLGTFIDISAIGSTTTTTAGSSASRCTRTSRARPTSTCSTPTIRRACTPTTSTRAHPADSVPARVAQLLRVEADPATSYTTAKPGTEVVLLGTNSTRANIGSENDGRDTAFASCMSPTTPSGTPVEDCIASDEDSHTIGTVVFAPDGSLFVSSGDGSNYERRRPAGAALAEPRQPRREDPAHRSR